MPLYDYRCGHCQAKREVLLKLDELDSTVKCYRCDQPMARQLSAPMVVGDYPPYQCPVSGKWIEGRRAHIENLKQTGCRVLEPGEAESSARARAKAEADLEAKIDAHVEAEIHNMEPRKREQLASELQAGATAEIIRSTKEN